MNEHEQKNKIGKKKMFEERQKLINFMLVDENTALRENLQTLCYSAF